MSPLSSTNCSISSFGGMKSRASSVSETAVTTGAANLVTAKWALVCAASKSVSAKMRFSRLFSLLSYKEQNFRCAAQKAWILPFTDWAAYTAKTHRHRRSPTVNDVPARRPAWTFRCSGYISVTYLVSRRLCVYMKTVSVKKIAQQTANFGAKNFLICSSAFRNIAGNCTKELRSDCSLTEILLEWIYDSCVSSPVELMGIRSRSVTCWTENHYCRSAQALLIPAQTSTSSCGFFWASMRTRFSNKTAVIMAAFRNESKRFASHLPASWLVVEYNRFRVRVVEAR